MGSATCDALARSGVRVIGVDRHVPPHAAGSSGGETRLLRKAYWEHPDYVPLVARAIDGWRALEERIGRRLFLQMGCLTAGPADSDLIAGTERAAVACDLEIDRLTPTEVAQRYPQFALPEDYTALFDNEAGLLLSTQAISASIASAERAGADFRFAETVRQIDSTSNGATVVTDRRTLHAAHVVLTAGPWSTQLLGELDLGLSVRRQVLSWVEPLPSAPGRGSFSSDVFPAWLVEPNGKHDQGAYYGFPTLSSDLGCELSARGVKIGHHHPGVETTPEEVDRSTTAADEPWRSSLDAFIPGVCGRTIGSRVCLYTLSPDEQFIIDQHPELPAVTVACGFSGHGFKFAPAIGEALAEMATGHAPSAPIEFLGLQRFTSS